MHTNSKVKFLDFERENLTKVTHLQNLSNSQMASKILKLSLRDSVLSLDAMRSICEGMIAKNLLDIDFTRMKVIENLELPPNIAPKELLLDSKPLANSKLAMAESLKKGYGCLLCCTAPFIKNYICTCCSDQTYDISKLNQKLQSLK